MSLPSICIENFAMTRRVMRVLGYYLLIFGAVLGVCVSSSAAVLEKAVMPGELSQAHAKFENDCNACHTNFDKSKLSVTCAQCHKDISADIVQRKGFHGKDAAAIRGECRQCHSEHKGRNARIMPLDRDVFDHSKTDFPLKGEHQKLEKECGVCHVKGKPFRAAVGACNACHNKDDVHKGTLGTQCANCHNEQGWKKIGFDHSKTQFPLTGKHGQTSCRLCHINNSFKGTPKDCVACHKMDDVHKSPDKTHCNSCHTTQNWKQVRFDHSQVKQFPLIGKHLAVRCESCHKTGVFTAPLKHQCVDCHAKQDIHKGSLGRKCEQCHTPLGWKSSTFNHNRDTTFPLRGAHAQAQCKQCHKTVGDKPSKACVDCHGKQDVHKGTEGRQCGNCHGETSWIKPPNFDHVLTRFPLVGQHALLTCRNCHVDHQFTKTPMACAACHQKNDVHKGAMGRDCGMCHSPKTWRSSRFDHNNQTHFPLTGAHISVSCADCHKGTLDEMKKHGKDCYACHAQHDAHDGKFGRACEKCHDTTSFKHIRQ